MSGAGPVRGSRRSPLGTALLVLVVATGCAGGRIARIEESVSHIEARIDQFDRDRAAQNDRLERTFQDLNQLLETMRGHDADLLAELSGVRDELARLSGRNEELARAVAQLKRTLEDRHGRAALPPAGAAAGSDPGGGEGLPPTRGAQPVDPAAPTPPPTAGMVEDDYRAAYDDFVRGQYQRAILAFGAFLKRYPGADLAPNAQYWIGECYYSLGDYDAAQRAFIDLIEEYPDSTKVADAMLKAGFALLELNRLEEGRRWLTRLVERYPDSSPARLARDRLADL